MEVGSQPNILETAFPGIEDIDDYETDMLDGLPDLDGRSLRFFETIPEEYRKAIQNFAHEDYRYPYRLAHHLLGLVEGYHLRDEGRRAHSAKVLVLHELRMAADYHQALQLYDEIPLVATSPDHDEEIGWEMNDVDMVATSIEGDLGKLAEELSAFIEDPSVDIYQPGGAVYRLRLADEALARVEQRMRTDGGEEWIA